MKVLFWVLLLLPLLGCEQDFTAPATGTIYGTLLHTDSRPAADMVVMVEGTGLSTVTDAKGQFVINGVLAVDEIQMGRYYTIRGYGDHDGHSVGFLVGHFKVKGQQSYGIGTVVVQRTGSIIGSVVLPGRVDNSGVRISIVGTSLETISQADGSYFLTDVPAYGGYELECAHEAYMPMEIVEMYDDGELVPIFVEPVGVTVLPTATFAAP